MKLLAKLSIGIFAIVLLIEMLPTIEQMVAQAFSVATAALLAIAPKMAVGSGLTALVLGVIPWTRHHAAPMLRWAVMLAVGSAAVTAVFAWLGAESSQVAPHAVSLAGAVVGKALGGLTSGIG